MQTILWKLFGKKWLLGGALTLYKAMSGKRTYLATGAMIAVYVAKTLGLIPAEIADALLAYLAGITGPTFMEKINRIDAKFDIQKRAKELREEAAKRLQESGALPPGVPPAQIEMDPMVQAEAERIIAELQALRG